MTQWTSDISVTSPQKLKREKKRKIVPATFFTKRAVLVDRRGMPRAIEKNICRGVLGVS